MRKLVISLSICFLSVFVQAQGAYFGVSTKAAFFSQLGFEDTFTTNATLGAHFGGQIAESIDLRGGGELIVAGWPGLSFNLDAFYRTRVTDLSSAYVGLGVDAGLGLSGDAGAPLAGAHGVFGLEYDLEGVGLFVELQPFYYLLDLAGVTLKMGSNFYW